MCVLAVQLVMLSWSDVCGLSFFLLLVGFCFVDKSFEMCDSPGLALLPEESSSDGESGEEMNFSLGLHDVSTSQHDSTMFSIEFEPSGW